MYKIMSGIILALSVASLPSNAGNGTVNLQLEFKTHERSCQKYVDKLNKLRENYIVYLENERPEEVKEIYKEIEHQEKKLKKCEKKQKKDRCRAEPTGGAITFTGTF